MTIAAVLYDAITGGRIDWRSYARASAEALKTGLDRVLANPLVDDPRVVHLKFTEIVADPIASVHKVYNRASLPLRA